MPRPKGPKKNNGEASVTPVENSSANSAAEASQTKITKSATKPTIVKTESRTNIVPINLEDEIRRLAYLLSERRGFEPGHEAEDWLAAEHEVRQRYHQHSA